MRKINYWTRNGRKRVIGCINKLEINELNIGRLITS